MTRHRTRGVAVPDRVIFVGGQDRGSEFYQTQGRPAAEYASGEIRNDYLELSDMYDQSDTVGSEPLQWQQCFHERKTSSAWSGQEGVEFTFSPPVPNLYVRARYFPSIAIPPMPTINWNPYVESVATQLERGTSESFQSLVFIAEARKTWKMLRNPLKELTTGWRKTVKRRSAREAAKTASNVWLVGRFGWRPFMKDVESFSKLSADLLYKSRDLYPEERYSDSTVALSHSAFSPSYSSGLWKTFESMSPANWTIPLGFRQRLRDYNSKTTIRFTCYASDPLQKFNSVLDKLIVSSGMNATWRNIRDVIWELLPFSFVVDWFVDFGNVWRNLNDRTILMRASKMYGYSFKNTVEGTPEIMFCRPLWCDYEPGSLWYGKYPTNVEPVIKTLPTCKSSYYVRYQGLPPQSTSVFTSKGLTLLHGVDGLSLFLQRALR